jgi:hypothetical protein
MGDMVVRGCVPGRHLFNFWVGVSHAGYAVREELPILLLICVVPAAVALLVRWKFT